jgi:hypothetical protein
LKRINTKEEFPQASSLTLTSREFLINWLQDCKFSQLLYPIVLLLSKLTLMLTWSREKTKCHKNSNPFLMTSQWSAICKISSKASKVTLTMFKLHKQSFWTLILPSNWLKSTFKTLKGKV